MPHRSSLLQGAQDAVRDSIEGLLRGEHAAALNQKAYLYRSEQNQLISEVCCQSRHDVVLLHDLHVPVGDSFTLIVAGGVQWRITASRLACRPS